MSIKKAFLNICKYKVYQWEKQDCVSRLVLGSRIMRGLKLKSYCVVIWHFE